MAQIKPFFSIIIPTLNEEKYLGDILSDLALQSYREFEVIVVDGKSKDQTLKIASSFSTQLPRLTTLTSLRRHVCTQRNLGAGKAKGEYLVFMDADNRLPAYFLLGVKYQLEQASTDLLTTWLQPDIDTPHNNALATSFNLFFELNFKFKPNFLLESMIIINRDVFNKIGGFNERTLVGEGRDLIHKICKYGFTYRISNTPTYQYSFRRIRKYGTIGMAGRLAQNEILELLGFEQSKLTKQLYPMQGGKQFDQKQRTLISQLNIITKKNKSKFSKKINSLINLLSMDIEPKSLPKLKKQLQKLIS